MRIKTDPKERLHNFKIKEVCAIFQHCKEFTFENAIELGAGDGFQSQILAKYTKNLLCTEINEIRLNKLNLPNVRYQILDAEKVGEVFETQLFDLIFSSNLLEHLPNVDDALRGMHHILTDDGVAIHVLPNRIWKISTIIFFLPNKFISTVDKFLSGRLFKRRPGHKFGQPYKKKYEGSNQKMKPRKQSRLTKLFLPVIHGVSDNTFKELYAFGNKVWIRKFVRNGFQIVAVRQIGFSSGYAFGFKRINNLMVRLGIRSFTAFILCKKGCMSKYSFLWTYESKLR